MFQVLFLAGDPRKMPLFPVRQAQYQQPNPYSEAGSFSKSHSNGTHHSNPSVTTNFARPYGGGVIQLGAGREDNHIPGQPKKRRSVYETKVRRFVPSRLKSGHPPANISLLFAQPQEVSEVDPIAQANKKEQINPWSTIPSGLVKRKPHQVGLASSNRRWMPHKLKLGPSCRACARATGRLLPSFEGMACSGCTTFRRSVAW